MIRDTPSTCPHCGAKLTGHTGGLDNGAPQAGDMALCWCCRKVSVLVATPAGLLMRPATTEQMVDTIRNGTLTDMAKALEGATDPLEAGMIFDALKRKRRDMA